MPGEAQKVFTVAEANRAIPSLERCLERLWSRARSLAHHAPSGRQEVRRLGMEGGRLVPPNYFAAIEEIHAETRNLEDSGIILRDLHRGLVDFPAVLDGQEVFLCWLKGESCVAYFHDHESGFDDRQPLPCEEG